MTEKPILEGKFAVSFDPDGIRIQPISDDLYVSLVGQCAECSIPYHTEEVIYGALCMIVTTEPDVPAIVEMIALQELMPDIVADYKPVFLPLVF